jgi:hypothetical protein
VAVSCLNLRHVHAAVLCCICSYEHFYVVYCKFWELDSDHDFSLDKNDLARYNNCALTYQIVERIFAEVGGKAWQVTIGSRGGQLLVLCHRVCSRVCCFGDSSTVLHRRIACVSGWPAAVMLGSPWC